MTKEKVQVITDLEKLAGGFLFTEGPVWDAVRGCLYFSDIPANRIYQWSPGTGAKVFRQPSGNSNGLTLDANGSLVACEHGNRRVTSTPFSGQASVLASEYQGKRLNSPNDVVIRKDGSLYFTDPPYGLVDDSGKPILQEIPFQGVYRLAAGSSQLTLVVDDFDRPNGLAFSPDESLLYIDDTARGHIRVFQVEKDGSLSNGEVFAELTGEEPGVPDGMKVDTAGNVYCTGPGGVWIFSPNGEKIGLINTPEVAANVAFGETDWQTLFITATSSVYKIRINIPGMPVFS